MTEARQNIKLVASDLDLTLLDSKFEVRPDVKAMAHRLLDSGIQFMIVTGRMYPAAARIAKILELDVPIICFNGGLVKRGLSGQVLFQQAMEQSVAEQCTQYGIAQGLVVQLYVGDNYYAQAPNRWTDFYIHANIIEPVYEPDLFAVLQTGQCMKLLFMGEEEKLAAARDWVADTFPGLASTTTSHAGFLDILPYGINKGTALTRLAAGMGIEKREILAIGDNYNDLPFLEAAGVKIAMGNAVDALKEKADYITASHDQGGWCQAMEQFVFDD